MNTEDLIYKVSNETMYSIPKPACVKDAVVELRVLWEEFQTDIKNNDSIDVAAIPALKMSALLINFVDWFGDRGCIKLKEFVFGPSLIVSKKFNKRKTKSLKLK